MRPIDPGTRAALVDSLVADVPFARACKAAGITEKTGRAWADVDDELATIVDEAQERAAARAAVAKVEARVLVSRLVESVKPPAPRQPKAPSPPPEVTTEAGPQNWERVRASAAAMFPDAPPHLATLLWLDSRCQLGGMHALDPWWVWHLGEFYASGKMIDAGRVGLRGAKSVSVCRAVVNDALFTSRALDPETVGVIPIISSDRNEATDRFVAIKAALAACGVAPAKGEVDEGAIPDGIGGEYTSSTLPSGGGVIRTRDSQGHRIEFRIYPAAIRVVIGFTGIGGFCDEVDMWRDKQTNANPADQVLDLLKKRFTTQPSARLYVFSASYHKTSTHQAIIDRGPTDLVHVATLGELGAARDDDARASLAAGKGLADERLREKGDAAARDIPSWVTCPVTPIDRCFALARDLDDMFARFGGRAHDTKGARGAVASFDGLAEENRRLVARRLRDPWAESKRWPGLGPGDPRGIAAIGRGRGRCL